MKVTLESIGVGVLVLVFGVFIFATVNNWMQQRHERKIAEVTGEHPSKHDGFNDE